MIHINFYTKDPCPLCDEVIVMLELLREEYPFVLEERDITSNEDWLKKYQEHIPVIEIAGEQLYRIDMNYDSIKAFLAKSSGN